jgi:hypothetical protein
MHNRQCLALRSGFLLLAALLLPLLAAEAQLHASNRSKHMSPASPPTVDVPTNATLDYTGHAWGCQHGYQRVGNECLVLHMPANAAIDYTGHAWECQQGYQRAGNQCVVVHMPANATLDYDGHAWECERGYQRVGNECLVLHMPANAAIDYTGHAWACQQGYQRAGNQCVVVRMPANAAIDYTGHAWECQQGYRRVGDACENMTALPKTAMYSSSAVQESRVNPPQQNDAKEAIRHIQEQLQQAGFDPGPLDGILGPRTMKALDRSLATR